MLLIGESLPGAAKCSIADLAGERGVVQERMLTDLLRADPEAWIVYHCLDEADVDTAVLWPDSMICSDSWSHPVNAPNQFGDPHPRTYGAFTRFLERYALTGRIPFGKAVRKLTSLPAAWLGLSDRGRIEEGAAADLVLLDPARLKEKATFEKPRQMSEGCVRVWVNGVTVLADGEILGARPGRFLRRASAAIRS
jgi:N-acyl-D-amino-acid deacylase